MLRVAYIPEHFSSPVFLALKHKFFKLPIEFVPVIEGTGRLVKLLNDDKVDVAIGLTEGFISDIANGNNNNTIIGTYVKSPLCWAISTGSNRSDLTSRDQLNGATVGVSRIGSGSYVMSYVLANQLKFDKAFSFNVLDNFKNLRDGVNQGVADFFMWEHFTSKRYYDNGEIKRIGEIYTPWPSWVIVASKKALEAKADAIDDFSQGVIKGIEYFNQNPDEAVKWIAENLDYTEDDAREWLKTVEFNPDLKIDWETVVNNTKATLQQAGVLTDSEETLDKRLIESVRH
ncbi:hypothetical protein DIURU_003482 [Diutina rugosa]|uniref:Ca3427-like PBP 2 domain-containing protein n=1 Tax=Diutina rugosa TaxID=5481 RepID=A0A642UKW1_DIURU|nr:uncharacterized protein DIURU_003482 [Diutina rugosa]KAA8901112.1 hypothetical protein DIURU_003482 [Diutina rugosa]